MLKVSNFPLLFLWQERSRWRTTSVLFFRDLVYIFASIRKNWNSAHVPLICSLFGSTHLSGTSVLSKGYKFLNTLKANLNKFETPVTIQRIRYFQISWPDVALLILKTVNVCIVTFLFFWRDRHRNSETNTKNEVCKVTRINHGVSKIFQGLIRWSTELQLKPNLSEYVNDERPFVFKVRKEGILWGTVSTMIYMLKREITKAKFKFISFVSSKYAFAMFSSRWSKDLTSLKKEINYLGIYYPTYFLVLIMSCRSNEPFSIVTNSKSTFQTLFVLFP